MEEKSFHQTTDYFFEKMNKGFNKYINSRKHRIEKKSQLIKYLENFNKKDNSNDYINRNIKNRKTGNLLKSNFEYFSKLKKSDKFANTTANNSSNKMDIVNNNFKQNKNKSNNFAFNLITNENSKNISNGSNLKTKFNNLKLKNIFNNNQNKNKKNTRYDSFFESQNLNSSKPENYNITIAKNNLDESELIFPSFFVVHKETNISTIKNNINNRTFHKEMIKSKTLRKILNPFKYSNNYKQNCMLKQIFQHPNLKLLYNTNELRVKNMLKSKSKSKKKKLSLLKYQYNLIENTLTPLEDGEKNKILQTFNKINSNAKYNKKLDLCGYLKEIQEKEKEIIQCHNEIEDIYAKNIQKIGFPLKGKRKIHIGKMSFKDIFNNRKYYKYMTKISNKIKKY